MRESPELEGVVVSIDEDDQALPIRVQIAPYAAVYFIDRDDPHLSAHLAVLKASLDEQKTITFTHGIPGERLRAVALAAR